MLTVHHLNNSRSQRILWLLEELGTEYEIRRYERDQTTNRAPADLKSIHPLGKSPVITDGDKTIAETGAIIEYILENHGNGRFVPEKGTEEYDNYRHFMHYAEGSAMFPFLLAIYTSYLGEAAAPLNPVIMQEIKSQLDYMEYHLIRNEYIAGDELTGADFMVIFPLEAAKARGRLKGYDACKYYVEKIHKRPAYLKALAKGGDYAFGPDS